MENLKTFLATLLAATLTHPALRSLLPVPSHLILSTLSIPFFANLFSRSILSAPSTLLLKHHIAWNTNNGFPISLKIFLVWLEVNMRSSTPL